MFSRIRSAVCTGLEGRDVYVETDIARGLPGINIVGLASTMVMESRDRIKSAILNSGYEFPKGRITVNLTPASLRKNGSCLDLPIAVGIMAAGFAVNAGRAEEFGIIGELSLDGKVLGVNGVLPEVISMQRCGITKVILPAANLPEARLIRGIELYPVSDLYECIDLINDNAPGIKGAVTGGCGVSQDRSEQHGDVDFADISGQENAKRAIIIAAAGRHGLLMIGSPGCGKSMLARRIPTVMPALTRDEMIETAVIQSITGREIVTEAEGDIIINRPFRSPHHTIGRAGLIGGGNRPVPGEITLAHNGVLFLDEICEFKRDVIESLRIPMEERKITHFRKGESYTFPCEFQLVMAANPCPCGYYGDPDHICRCSEHQLELYRRRLSGPIMDRIDMRITMEKVQFEELRPGEQGGSMSSEDMRKAVTAALRFAAECGRTGYNALMDDAETDRCCTLGTTEEKFLGNAYKTLNMSPRSYKKTLRVARTIADLALEESIREEHIAEALSYRTLERINE